MSRDMHARSGIAPEVLDTARLTAERIGPQHREALISLHADPQVMATMGGCQDSDQTAAFITTSDRHWAAEGFGMYALFARLEDLTALSDEAAASAALSSVRSGTPNERMFAGRAGLRRCVVDQAHRVEIAYAFHAACWGRGLATEIASALASIAFTDLSLAEVVAFALPHNAASRRVMEKIGMRYEREFLHHDLHHVLYALRPDAFIVPA